MPSVSTLWRMRQPNSKHWMTSSARKEPNICRPYRVTILVQNFKIIRPDKFQGRFQFWNAHCRYIYQIRRWEGEALRPVRTTEWVKISARSGISLCDVSFCLLPSDLASMDWFVIGKKEKVMLANLEKACGDKIAAAECSLKKKKQVISIRPLPSILG